MGRLDRYVLFRTFAGVGAALAVISAVILLVQFVDLSRSVGVRADVGVGDLFLMTLYKSPGMILLLLPFVFLGGGMSAYIGMNRRSELVAMRAAGVSAWRFIVPSAAAAFMAGALTVTLFNPLAADLSARFESKRASLLDTYLGDTPKEVWLRQGDEKNLMVIHARARDNRQGKVHLRGVSVYIYQKDERGLPRFKRRIEAGGAELVPGFWRLTDVREASAGENSVRSDSLSIRSTLDAESAMERLSSPESISFWKLPGAISQTELAGFSAAGYRLRLEQLLATPLLFAAMAVLAAAFSLRLDRLGGLAGLAGVGAAFGFVFFFFNQFSGALAGADIIPLTLAAWAPPTIALLSGLMLLCYTEDG